MKRSCRVIVIAFMLLGCSLAARAQEPVFNVTVDPAGVPREQVPVTIEMRVGRELTAAEGERLSNGAKVTIDGMTQTQAEVIRDQGDNVAAVLVHYVERGLPAGSKRTLRVRLEPECECEAAGFRFEDALDHRDLWYEAWPIYRHVTAYDPKKPDETFMPFHHVYGFHDEGFITKGPGGDHPHHRGLFWAFNTNFGNFWTGAKGVSQRHVKYEEGVEKVGRVTARAISYTDWCDAAGNAVARDKREVRAYCVDEGWFVLDFTITTEAVKEPLVLGGDAQHAGFHYRASQEVSVDGAKTGTAKFVRPPAAKNLGNDVWGEAPWVAMQYAVKGNAYAVVMMDHASNPRPTVFSTRAYGRMGALFTKDGKTPVTVEAGKPLTARYRVVVLDGKKWASVGAEKLNSLYSDYVSPVKVTTERAK